MQIYKMLKKQTVTRCCCPQQNRCVFSNRRNSRKVCSVSRRWRGKCLGRERWPMDHEALLFLVLLSGTLCHRPHVYRPLHSDSFRVD